MHCVVYLPFTYGHSRLRIFIRHGRLLSVIFGYLFLNKKKIEKKEEEKERERERVCVKTCVVALKYVHKIEEKALLLIR